jgi:hypothetical protein
MNEGWDQLVEIAQNLCVSQKINDDSLKATIKDIVKKIIEADNSLTSEMLEKRAVDIYVEQIVIANRLFTPL